MENQDHFEDIRGIGPAIAKGLIEAGIMSFSDLAAHDEESLADLLQENFRFINAEKIRREGWIEAARERVASRDVGVTAEGVPLHVPELAGEVRPEDTPGNDHLIPHKPGWKTHADFYITFGRPSESGEDTGLHTEVHHYQEDQTFHWDYVARDELLAWIFENAGLDKPQQSQEDVEPRVRSIEPVEASAGIVLDRLSIRYLGSESVGNRKGVLRAQCELELSGPDALELTYERQPYLIEVWLQNKDTRRSELVCSAEGNFVPDQLRYDIECDFDLPLVGSYESQLLASVKPPVHLPPSQIQGRNIIIKQTSAG